MGKKCAMITSVRKLKFVNINLPFVTKLLVVDHTE